MGRPKKSGPSIVVDVDGELIVWTDGLLSCDNREYVKDAKRASFLKVPTDLSFHGPTIPADLDDVENVLGVVAAMIAVNPGRAIILSAPDSVLDALPYEADDENLKRWIEEQNAKEVVGV